MTDQHQVQDNPEHVADHDQSTILGTPVQVLSGMHVGLPDLHAECTGCGDAITEGQACYVYAYRPGDGQTWYPARCYCRACAPDGITTPTLGTSEVLVRAWLGTVARPRDRSHRLCLGEVECVAVSPPTEGQDP